MKQLSKTIIYDFSYESRDEMENHRGFMFAIGYNMIEAKTDKEFYAKYRQVRTDGTNDLHL